MHGGAGPAGREGCSAESPKQESKRFNSITKTIHFAHASGYTVYCNLSMAGTISLDSGSEALDKSATIA